MEDLQTRISCENNAALIGTQQELLVEGTRQGKWYGRTRNNKIAFFESPGDLIGTLVHLRITEASSWSLQGAPTYTTIPRRVT